VISQDSLPVRENLKKRGVRFGIDFILKGRLKPDIKAEFCLSYLRTMFLPNLKELRALEKFAHEDAVLLMDSQPNHVTDKVLGLLRGTRVITWAPDTIQIFQQLDVSLFGVLK
jgi:hypothetical protein